LNFSQRKKLIFVVFGLLVIAVLGFFAVRPNSYNYEGLFSSNSLDNGAQRQAFNSVTKKDSDEDGLKDWEEELWGTDPNNKDTDADGTNDGDEINQNRNPLKAGPNDVLSDEEILSVSKDNNVYDEVGLTATDKFAQDFFTEYLLLKDSEGVVDEYGKNLLIESTISKVLDSDDSLIGYTNSDLIISDNIDKDFVRVYGNTLGRIIFDNSPETDSESDILNKIIAGGSKEEVRKIDIIISSYNNTAKEMFSVSVPKDAVEKHIDLIESIEQISKYIEDIGVINEDPIRAIVGIEGYERGILTLDNSLNNLRNYFANKGVIFDEGEVGSIFLNNI
jgi:hypothetical protein